jgi:replicative DNA helicase
MMYFVKEYARFENLTSASNDSPMMGNGGKNGGGNPNLGSGNDGPPPMPHSPAPDEDAPF